MHLSVHPQHSFTRVIGALVASLAMVAATLAAPPDVEAQASANFVFTGAGWGHGVGMSQNGARNMAAEGLDHVAILATYYPNTVVSEVPPLDSIRVHIGDASRVELSSAGPIIFERGGVALNQISAGSIQIAAHDGGLQIGDIWTTGNRTDPVFVSFPQPVKISNNGHSYLWGKLQITNRNGKVRVVEDLPLEKYVAGISEMPAAWPLEALMAQAIAARTYAHEVTLHRRASLEWDQEYDISGSTVDQNYIGWDAQDGQWDQKWLAVVQATAGVEIVDNNGPIRAYYSASNGGWTETAAYVFGNDVPYTVAGPDPFDAGGHDWSQWTRTYSQTAMSRWLNAHADTSVGTLTQINVLGGQGASARLDKATVELIGTAGAKRTTGKRLMVVMNAGIFGEGLGLDDHLPGTFTTIGNGAGAGMPLPQGRPIPAQADPDVAAGDEPRTFTAPPGWTPEPGTGVPPVGRTEAAEVTSAGDTAPSLEGLPEGWAPEPGTGVAPTRSQPPTDTSEPIVVPEGLPEGWAPEPGTGVAPRSANIAPTADAPTSVPADWEPEPGTGVPPGSIPIGGDTSTVGGTGGGLAADWAALDDLPEGWAPQPGTGTPPGWTPEPGTGVPAGWAPEPGTGVAPVSTAGSLASTVLLVTGSSSHAVGDAQFRVIAPTDELADEARDRLSRLQTQAAAALFAEFDVDGYVASVAPRPVHGVCTATDDGISCISLAALREAGSGTADD